jgi:uncharacterized protein YukE
MSISALSLNPGEMERQAGKCDDAASDLDKVIHKLDGATEPSSSWTGPSAESFRAVVQQHLQTARSAQASLRAAAGSLRQDAARARSMIAAELQRQAALKKTVTGAR